MRDIDLIVIHCSATPPEMNIGVDEIDKWHRARGYKRIGYHYVIKRSGAIQLGRPEEEMGAHVAGHNARSIGICMVGGVSSEDKKTPENNFTQEQWATLTTLLRSLLSKYGEAKVCGHNQLNSKKACPSFSVPEVFGNLFALSIYNR